MNYFKVLVESTQKFKERKEIKAIQESMTVEVVDEAYSVSNKNFTGTIQVYGSEGPIPHFHVITSDGREACFCIFEPLYANHESYHVPLDKKELFGLNVFLMSPDRKIKDIKISYWEEIVREWVQKNMDHNFDHKYDYESVKKPDYNHIKGFKDMGKKAKRT